MDTIIKGIKKTVRDLSWFELNCIKRTNMELVLYGDDTFTFIYDKEDIDFTESMIKYCGKELEFEKVTYSDNTIEYFYDDWSFDEWMFKNSIDILSFN
jgi:hypothetical protein